MIELLKSIGRQVLQSSRRFITNKPVNAYEAAVFTSIREILAIFGNSGKGKK